MNSMRSALCTGREQDGTPPPAMRRAAYPETCRHNVPFSATA
nr:hypothetical protein [Xanthomonas oryzae]